MKRRVTVALVLVLVLTVLAIVIGGCGVSEQKGNESKSTEPATSPASSPQSTSPQVGPDGNPIKTLADFPDGQDGAKVEAVIKTDKGDIVLRFFPDSAPVTVASFLHLARTGFFNGTTFHRVVPGFVIQGGDPKSKDPKATDVGTGGPGYNLPAEFNNRPHVTGTLSMARGGDPNSGGSQFFICLADQPSLNGQYTVFGQVVSGMDVVNQVTQGTVMQEVTIRPISG